MESPFPTEGDRLKRTREWETTEPRKKPDILKAPLTTHQYTVAWLCALPISRTFSNIKVYLFVGIDSGVPFNPPCENPDEDIHLGDVVVRWPETQGAPAVIQLDFGRVLEGNLQQNTSHLNFPTVDF